MELLRAVVEGSRGGVEHAFEDMPVAAGEDEQAVVHALDISAEQRFHVLLGIMGDLLKLIDGEDARFVGLFQIAEDLL
jgi:hypothetical protein